MSLNCQESTQVVNPPDIGHEIRLDIRQKVPLWSMGLAS